MADFQEKIKNYFRDKKEVLAVYLFGSHAGGKERYFSDIDIGIILDGEDPESFLDRREKYMAELGRILRMDIDAVILNTANSVLLSQIFLKGKCILVNNSKKLAIHKTIMFVKIAEFGYYRNHMQAGLIRKIIKG